MPIYEYLCGTCGTEFEELVRSGKETPNCPVCEGKDVTKKVSMVSASCDSPGGGYSYPSRGGCTSFGWGVWFLRLVTADYGYIDRSRYWLRFFYINNRIQDSVFRIQLQPLSSPPSVVARKRSDEAISVLTFSKYFRIFVRKHIIEVIPKKKLGGFSSWNISYYPQYHSSHYRCAHLRKRRTQCGCVRM